MKRKNKYLENKVLTTAMGAESVEALLMNLGIDSVSVEDPVDARYIIESKNVLKWDFVNDSISKDASMTSPEAVLRFYTKDDNEGNNLLSDIKKELLKLKERVVSGQFGSDANFGKLSVESTPLDDDWENSWKENFVPTRISEKFIVTPPWGDNESIATPPMNDDESIAAPPMDGTESNETSDFHLNDNSKKHLDVHTIVIDPGMVFGTGTHETTSMCVEGLEKTVSENCIVLDVGTGTGILAIAAIKLKAGKVVAIEFDSDAVVSATKNIEMNNASDRIDLIEGDILKLEEMRATGVFPYEKNCFDIIIANLTSGLLKKTLASFFDLIKPGGHLILSGLLDSEENDMVAKVNDVGFKNINSKIKGEWLCICADS